MERQGYVVTVEGDAAPYYGPDTEHYTSDTIQRDLLLYIANEKETQAEKKVDQKLYMSSGFSAAAASSFLSAQGSHRRGGRGRGRGGAPKVDESRKRLRKQYGLCIVDVLLTAHIPLA